MPPEPEKPVIERNFSVSTAGGGSVPIAISKTEDHRGGIGSKKRKSNVGVTGRKASHDSENFEI